MISIPASNSKHINSIMMQEIGGGCVSWWHNENQDSSVKL